MPKPDAHAEVHARLNRLDAINGNTDKLQRPGLWFSDYFALKTLGEWWVSVGESSVRHKPEPDWPVDQTMLQALRDHMVLDDLADV